MGALDRKEGPGPSQACLFLLKSGSDSVGLLGGHLALTQAGLQGLHP